MEPKNPKHADKVVRINGVSERLTLRRRLVGYAYPRNGNVHNPTPRYMWDLLCDHRVMMFGTRASKMQEAAVMQEEEILAEADWMNLKGMP